MKRIFALLSGAMLAASAWADFEVYFLRHGETPWNRAKLLQGSVSHVDLTEKGVRMAEATAAGLRREGIAFDRAYTSPYRRAAHTAEIVAGSQGLKPTVEPRIREMCFGKYEGTFYAKGAYADDNLRHFFEEPEKYVPQGAGAESFDAVGRRLRGFLEDELVPLDGKVRRVLCVAHSLVLKSLLREMFGDNIPEAAKRPIQRNCCVHVLRYSDGKFSLKEAGRIFYDPAAFDVHPEPVKVIFDTDMYTDFDDAGALACLHALADAGECEILATVANTRESMSVAMCEIVNAYYGRPDIPVGCVKGLGLGNDRDKMHDQRYGAAVRKYARWVKHLNSDDAPDAADVYRKVLSAQPDNSVVICSVGFLSNMRKLMETDRELVARKVKRWVAMACSYPKGREYNSMKDWESSKIALERWPTPIVFTDFQYGRDCYAGRALAESSVEGNPVADVFRQNVASCNGAAGRSAWDETAVLIAVRGIEPYFGCERGTYRMVGNEGEDEWRPDPASRDCRVTEAISKAEIGRVLDHLMLQSPKRR